MENDVKTNSPRAWLLAARPKTLSAAAVPVMVGSALAAADLGADFQVLPCVLCFLFAFIMQIDANFINDYFDFRKGSDRTDRLGPERACAQGWITPRAMQGGIVVTTLLACVAGLPLLWIGGWELLLVGAVYLLWRKVITWHIPVAVLGTMAVFVFLVGLGQGMHGEALWEFPLFHLLAGGAILGAVYMATDYSTSPMTHTGMLIYGVGIGIITVLIRLWGAYPEGMSFAILIMNSVVPLINKYVKPRRFGLK